MIALTPAVYAELTKLAAELSRTRASTCAYLIQQASKSMAKSAAKRQSSGIR